LWKFFAFSSKIKSMTPLAHAKKAIKANPAKVTAKEFLAMIEENPSVFKEWETPLEITEFVA
jgi:hypothetical protein